MAGAPIARTNTPAAGGAGAGPIPASNNNSTTAVNVPIRRKRLSYLIPPPPANSQVPYLVLPEPAYAASARRGNPNPLIILAEDQQSYHRARSGSASSNFRIGNGPSSPTSRRSSNTTGFAANGQYNGAGSRGYGSSTQQQRHPEHTLGVSALAIDTSTVLEAPSSFFASSSSSSSISSSASSGSSSGKHHRRPAGILYSGGRDGLVASWELGLPFKRRSHSEEYVGNRGSKYRPRWAEDLYDSEGVEEDEEDVEVEEAAALEREEQHSSEDEEDMTGGLLRDETSEQDDDEEQSRMRQNAVGTGRRSREQPRLSLDTSGRQRASNGLFLDNMNGRARRSPLQAQRRNRASSNAASTQQQQLPYERRWQLDEAALDDAKPPSTTFRQAHRGHTDWVNDLVLCNLNQSVITASSDRQIRLWNPHDPHRSMLPAKLGQHADYVKCLSYAREPGWVASGGFDRKLRVWDVMESRKDPIVDWHVDSSVYASATNASGQAIAIGTPDKVVRMYDPRTSQMAARLVGHAENVRSILLSEDGRHVLSASSDATVKLWSVSMQRCLHTFTYHSDSVWSLFSSHPHLETFYSGDRTGTVCKVDFTDCGDIASEGECVVLLRNRDENRPGSPTANDGINRIVALDDTFIWTASGNSNINRWRDIPAKSKRIASTPSQTKSGQLMHDRERAYSAGMGTQDGSLSAYSGNTYGGQTNPFSDPVAAQASPIAPAPPSGQPLTRTVSNDRTVAFATQPIAMGPSSGYQRSSPNIGSSGSPFNKPSSLRFQQSRQGSSALSQSQNYQNNVSTPPGALSPIASSPVNENGRLGGIHASKPSLVPTSTDMPSLNQVPVESLVPLMTADDPYAATSSIGYGMRSGMAGYSASVLSLHRTSSRPLAGGPGSGMLSSSPYGLSGFGGGSNTTTPPSSNLSAPRGPISSLTNSYGRSNSPLPPHRAASIVEEEGEEFTPLFGNGGTGSAGGGGLSSAANIHVKSEAYILAQQEYEDRETALDGVPLRSRPDDIIRGRHGLVRAELLNDRRTVLSMDTLGEVAVWDIILGGCIGQFSPADLKKDKQTRTSGGLLLQGEEMTSRSGMNGSIATIGAVDAEDADDELDLLEYVRKRIEGEAVTATWCSVESRTGLLTVHIEPSRAFEAEVYIDQAGVPPKPEYRVDQRLNLGKWVIRNLLDQFIKEELKLQSAGRRESGGSGGTIAGATESRRPSVVSSEGASEDSVTGPSSPRQRRPSHISLNDGGTRANKDGDLGSSWSSAVPGVGPGGFSIALATPAMTPAVLPDVSDLTAHLASPRLLPGSLPGSNLLTNTLPTIPQSPDGNRLRPSTPLNSANAGMDYFSRPRATGTAPYTSSEPPSGTQTPRPAAPAAAPAVPSTPSGSASNSPVASKVSKMSRFKSFGKKDAKRELSLGGEGAPPSTPTASADSRVILPFNGNTDADSDPYAHLAPAERAQMKLLTSIFAHPLQPPPWLENPPIRFAADLPIIVGEEDPDAGAWETVHRGLVSRAGTDAPILEMTLPSWVLEFCLHNVAIIKDQTKIAFVLEPWGGAEKAGLPALPSGNARLSATRMLRMRKACAYIAEKLELPSWRQRQQYQAQNNARPSTSSTDAAQSPSMVRSKSRTSLSSATSHSHLPTLASASASMHESQNEPTLLPEDEIEILCHDKPIPLDITLAACAKFFYGKSGDVYLNYRRRRPNPSTDLM